jgi:hypothetical protein
MPCAADGFGHLHHLAGQVFSPVFEWAVFCDFLSVLRFFRIFPVMDIANY